MPVLKNQIALDREPVYDVLDRIRASLPFTIKAVRLFRQRREEDGDPPLRSGALTLDVLAEIDAVDDLMHRSPPVPLTDRVRVKHGQLEPVLDRIRTALLPLAQELADFNSIYSTR